MEISIVIDDWFLILLAIVVVLWAGNIILDVVLRVMQHRLAKRRGYR